MNNEGEFGGCLLAIGLPRVSRLRPGFAVSDHAYRNKCSVWWECNVMGEGPYSTTAFIDWYVAYKLWLEDTHG